MKCPSCGACFVALSKQQTRIADLLLDGYEDKEIAAKLGISRGTVRGYLINICRKYGIRDGDRRIKLAVAIYYERNPEKRIAMHRRGM